MFESFVPILILLFHSFLLNCLIRDHASQDDSILQPTTPVGQQRITKLIYKPNEYTRLVGLIEMQMGMPYSGL